MHFCCAFILLFLAASISRASDWAHFLGPTRDGVSTEVGLIDRWGTNGVPILWKRELGVGYSAPSVRHGRLVFFHRQGNDEVIEAVNAVKGTKIWQFAYPSKFQDPYGYNSGPRCSPVLSSNRCFTLGAEGTLTCLDLERGSKIWRRDLLKEFSVPEAFFGVGSTPVLEDGRLLVMVGGQPNSSIAALDPETGKTLWESVGESTWDGAAKLDWPGQPKMVWNSEEKTASYSTLMPAKIAGRSMILGVTRQGLVAVVPDTGKLLFSRWFRARVDESVNAMTPVIWNDLILISSAYYRSGSLLMRVKPDGMGFDEIWRGLGLEMHWSQPIRVGGFLYGFSGRNEPDAHFRCIEFESGTVQWDRDERWPPHSTKTPAVFGRGSLMSADKKLWALGEGGLLGLFRPNTSKCEEISRWQVPGFEHPCWAAPVLSDKRLYLQSEKLLVCLDVEKK